MAPQSSETLLPVIERYAGKPASLLVLLHELQDLAGYVPPELVPQIASRLNLSRAEVHGVLTYYNDFRDSAPPRVVLKLCRAEACQSMGTEALAAHIEAHTGCQFDGKRDAALGLESVYCLGQCAQSRGTPHPGRHLAADVRQRPDALDQLRLVVQQDQQRDGMPRHRLRQGGHRFDVPDHLHVGRREWRARHVPLDRYREHLAADQ